MQALFEKMKTGKENVDKILKNARFHISDYNKYNYYYEPGLPLHIETRRESIIGMDSQETKIVEICRIELITDDEL